jgi:hypothetical protein
MIDRRAEALRLIPKNKGNNRSLRVTTRGATATGDDNKKGNSDGRRKRVAMVVVPEQVVATAAAEKLMGRLEEKYGELMFHQSGGCCDGSSPMCYPRGEFLVGDSDVLMATLGGTPFYMSKSQFEYWKHTQLILDVVPGRGGMFSLENGEGVRFLIRSRVFTDEEIGALRAAGRI